MRFYLLLVCTLLTSLSSNFALAAGDVTPSMAKVTMDRIQHDYGVRITYLENVLVQLPVYRASSDFLGKYGSSMGIYFRKALYLNESIFDSQGLSVDPIAFGVILHEGWHGYYDQLLSYADRVQLENIWSNYYSQMPGTNRDRAIWIGDEAVGNYSQAIGSVYAHLAVRYREQKPISASLLRMYQSNYEGKDINGYDSDGTMSDLPISANEVSFYLRLTGATFPNSTQLPTVLAERFPK